MPGLPKIGVYLGYFVIFCNKLILLCVNICNIRNHKSIVNERRSKILGLLTRGLKNFEIANMLNVDAATISRDISALTIDSQNYLNSLARETLPFMYEHRRYTRSYQGKLCYTPKSRPKGKHVSKVRSSKANQGLS